MTEFVQSNLNIKSVLEVFNSMDKGHSFFAIDYIQNWFSDHSYRFAQLGYDDEDNDGNDDFQETNIPLKSILPVDDSNFLTLYKSISFNPYDHAVKSAEKAHEAWKRLTFKERFLLLSLLSDQIDKSRELLCALYALDSAQPIQSIMEYEIAAIRSVFYQLISLAEKFGYYETISSGVFAIILSEPISLSCLLSVIAVILALGNTIVIRICHHLRFCCYFLQDICSKIGLSKGILNIIYASDDFDYKLSSHESVVRVLYNGSQISARDVHDHKATYYKLLPWEFNFRKHFTSGVIILSSADLHSVVSECIGTVYQQVNKNSKGCVVLVQESVCNQVCSLFKTRIQDLKFGHSLDMNTDCVVNHLTDDITSMKFIVDFVINEGAEVYYPKIETDSIESVAPVLITHAHSVFEIFKQNVVTPLIVVVPFRTTNEVVSIVNNDFAFDSISFWSQDLSLVLETTKLLKTSHILINQFFWDDLYLINFSALLNNLLDVMTCDEYESYMLHWMKSDIKENKHEFLKDTIVYNLFKKDTTINHIVQSSVKTIKSEVVDCLKLAYVAFDYWCKTSHFQRHWYLTQFMRRFYENWPQLDAIMKDKLDGYWGNLDFFGSCFSYCISLLSNPSFTCRSSLRLSRSHPLSDHGSFTHSIYQYEPIGLIICIVEPHQPYISIISHLVICLLSGSCCIFLLDSGYINLVKKFESCLIGINSKETSICSFIVGPVNDVLYFIHKCHLENSNRTMIVSLPSLDDFLPDYHIFTRTLSCRLMPSDHVMKTAIQERDKITQSLRHVHYIQNTKSEYFYLDELHCMLNLVIRIKEIHISE